MDTRLTNMPLGDCALSPTLTVNRFTNWVGRQVLQVFPATIAAGLFGGLVGGIAGGALVGTPISIESAHEHSGEIHHFQVEGARWGASIGAPALAAIVLIATEIFSILQASKGRAIYGNACVPSSLYNKV